MWSKKVAGVLLLALGGSSLVAGEAPRRVIALGAGDLGAIEGSVINGATGSGYEGAQVILYRQNGQIARIETTDAMGHYRSTPDLVPGTYFAVAENFNGDPPVLYDNVQCRAIGGGTPGHCSTSFGTAIEVTAGTVTAGIDFVTGPGVSLEGRVTAVGGQPLESVQVEVFTVSGERLEWFFTDAAGDYRTEGLFAGTYFVSASTLNRPGERHLPEVYDDLACVGFPGFDCDPTTGTPLGTTWGDAVTGVDFALEPLGTVSGTITDRGTGIPLVSARIGSYRNGVSQILGGFTLADGTWSSYALPGSYNLVASLPGYLREIHPDLPCFPESCDTTQGTLVTVLLGEDLTGIDFTLSRLGSLSGRVTDAVSGDPIGNHLVRLHAAALGAIQQTRTDSDGNYFFADVHPLDRFVTTRSNERLWVDEVYDDQLCRLDENLLCDLSPGTPVLVPLETDTTGIDFDLEPYLFADNFEGGGLFSWSQVIDGTSPLESLEPATSEPGGE
ncbi:MAG: hypothetical protein KDD47_27045 [Acidobacteria bacterium]|nr:hypothetical protein [Acidobacteriota bacterium]